MAFNSLSSAIEEIKLRSNIVDVINAVVPLKKTGSNYKACCPFHREKTPSFIVSEDKQIFTCFGCGATGDAIEFVKKYYNLQFPDAVRKLANQYGVEIADSYARQGQKRAPYYAANRMAARFFFDALTGKANPGYSYMKGRGFEDKTLVQFGIGYSDENWQSLTDYMKAAGISEEMLTELGLSSRQERRASLYDYFRGRVMFPIINTVGNVVGFGGRVLGDGVPKYLNSRESIVFEKKRNLYGLNLTKGDIREKGFAVLVEGYLDVMSLYQAGVRNVVATLGTALTSEQAKLLTKYTKKVILCYDADSAGGKDDHPHRPAGAVGQVDRATHRLVRLGGIGPQAHGNLDCLIEVGTGVLLDKGDRLLQADRSLRRLLGDIAISLAVLGHGSGPPRYFDAHAARRAFDQADRLRLVGGVEIGLLQLDNLTNLVACHLANLVAIGDTRAFGQTGGLLEQHGCRRTLQNKCKAAVGVDCDHHRDDQPCLVSRTGVEIFAELHDIHALCTECRTNRRCRIGGPRRHLQPDNSCYFLSHLCSVVMRLSRVPTGENESAFQPGILAA